MLLVVLDTHIQEWMKLVQCVEGPEELLVQIVKVAEVRRVHGLMFCALR